MDNREMSGIVAEKVHGWKCVLYTEPYGFVWHDEDGEYKKSTEMYDPAANIAQAIDAVNVWLDGLGKDDSVGAAFWNLSRGTEDKTVLAEIHIAPENKAERYYQAEAAIEALAITEALVKAVSDES